MEKSSSSRLQIYLLGHPQLKLDGLFVTVEEHKAVALLAYLAVNALRYSRDALATIFWPEQSQANARASLRHALWSLKESGLEAYLVKQLDEIGVQPHIWLDVEEFQRRVSEHRLHGHSTGQGCSICITSLAEAIALYKDDFLAGFTLRDSPQFDEWQYFQREQWKQLFGYALECLMRWHVRGREWAQAIDYARRWVALDPLHEPAQRWLMGIYARSGKRSLALKQYETLKTTLNKELGTIPEIETLDLVNVLRSNQPVANAWELVAGRDDQQAPVLGNYLASVEEAYWQPEKTRTSIGSQRVTDSLSFARVDNKASSHHFLERAAYIDKLHKLLLMVSVEGGRMVFLGAEAGGGKTTLVRTFCVVLRKTTRAYIGICDPLSTPRPLGPLWDIADDVGSDLARLLYEGEKPERTFQAFLELLRHPETPQIIVFEDVHWADEATLDLLRFIGRRIGSTRVLFIASFRDDEVDGQHPLQILLGDLTTTAAIELIHLPPLSRQAVSTLLSNSRIDVDEVYRRTGGNPFFVTELVASGLDQIPESVRNAVLVRAARLSPSARSVLDYLAVIGLRVEPSLFVKMSVDGIGALEECIAAGMLRANGEWMEFRHDLVRQAVLAAISPPRLKALHRQALEALKLSTGGFTDLARLAHHAEGAGDHQAVLEYATAAARQAAGAGAHRQAAEQYKRALRFASGLAAKERAKLLQDYASECYLCDRHGEALEALEEAAKLWRVIGDRLEEGANLIQQENSLYFLGELAQANRVNDNAIQVLSEYPSSSQLAHTYCKRVTYSVFTSDYGEAITLGRQVIELGERIGDIQTLIMTHNMIGVALLSSGETGGQEHLEHSIALAKQVDDQVGIAAGYSNLSRSVGQVNGWQAGNYFIAKGLEHCAELELDFHRFYLLASLADAQIYQGLWSEAESTLQFILSQSNIAADTRFWALVELSRLHARRGDPGVSAVLDKAMEVAEKYGVLRFLAPTWATKAEAAWLRSELDRILEQVRIVYDLAVRKRHPWHCGELAYWLWRGGELFDPPDWMMPAIALQIRGDWSAAAAEWQRRGCPYERAWALADGDEDARRTALEIFNQLGAVPAAAMLRRQMRAQGVQHIPRQRRQMAI